MCEDTLLFERRDYGLAELPEPIVGKDIPDSDRERLKGLETKAKNAKIGIWSETPPPEVPVTDMAPFSARELAMTYFQQIQNKKIVGVIERITSGSKFVVYSPEEKVIIRVNVNKVKLYGMTTFIVLCFVVLREKAFLAVALMYIISGLVRFDGAAWVMLDAEDERSAEDKE